ncbi:MAG: DUF4255 domain-containing protein [Eubacteriales bacterium]
MADYPIIADVSNFIVKHLRENMCPSPIPSPNNIEISSPGAEDVDYLLGLYLYDVQQQGDVSQPPLQRAGHMRMKRPPKPYTLSYMLFINGSSQMGLKGPDVQKIIGRAAQIVGANAIAFPNQLQTWLEEREPPILLTPARITLEEKVRVWQAINKPYQISLFYKAEPVFISSDVIIDVPMVNDARFNISITHEPGGR